MSPSSLLIRGMRSRPSVDEWRRTLNTKYDYDALEREYVTGTMGLRALAAAHGISNHSVITDQAKKRHWVQKRKDYQEGKSERAVTYMADMEGFRLAQEARVRDNAIEAIDEAIVKLRADMARTHFEEMLQEDGSRKVVEIPDYVLQPRDITALIDRLNVLFNRPAQITEERSLGISLSSGGLSVDLLRDIVSATRGVADTGASARSPLPRAERNREN